MPGDGSKTFPETGKTVTGLFLDYWNTHGGLEQQGYPITEAYNEVNDADGQTYITQYFERARFEYHPENGDPKFQVLLGLVGRESLRPQDRQRRYRRSRRWRNCRTPARPLYQTPEHSGWTHMAVTTNNVAFFYNSDNGHAASARLNPDGSLTVLQKFPDEATGNGAFDPGWDIITPGPYNYLFFYRRDSGAATDCLMGDNGIIVQCANFGFDTDWTSITIDRQTGVIYIYSGPDGHRYIERLNSDGSISTFSCDSNDIKSARKVIPIGYSMWLYYDFATKEAGTFSINKDTGEPKLLQGVPDLGLPWGLIASNQSTIGFYSPSGQSSLIASTALDGCIVKLRNYYAPPTISIIATALNGPYLNYSISTGELSVVQVAPDGTATNLQQYKP